MAHGYLNPTDLRTERNILGDIAGAIGNRIGQASNMARRERAYAESIAERNNTSLDEAGIGRGHFFQRALGSTFGGDALARTRGRFAKSPGMGLDPTGSQASRFRGGFVDRGRYDYSEEIFGAPASPGGALATLFSNAGGAGASVASKMLESGPSAINPEVLGGEIAKYQGTKTNAAGFTVDTTATEIKDIAGILNQIGQMMVRTNNSTIQAIDSVQKVNIKVVESVQSLGQLQVGIAERQLQQQRLLASETNNTQEKIAARQLAAAEKRNFTTDDFSGNMDPEGLKDPSMGGGGVLGKMLGGMGNLLDTGMNILGGGRRRRGIRGRQGFSTANSGDIGVRGMNFRNTTMTGNSLSRARIRAGTAGPNVFSTAQDDITKRYAQRYGERAATKRFGAEALQQVGMGMGKGRMLSRFLRPVLKRVPLVGGLLDFAVSLALGEPVGRAAAKAVGATLGAALGSLVPIPGVGTILGGIGGDFLGGAVYDALAGGSDSSMPSGADGMVSTGPKSGYLSMLHGTEVTLSGNKSKEMKAISENIGEGILGAQKKNKRLYGQIQAAGLAEYYDKQNGWQKFLEMLGQFFPKFEFKWPWDRKGGGGGDDDDPRGGRDPAGHTRRMLPGNYTFGHDLPATNTVRGQNYGASRDNGTRQHAGTDFDISGPDETFSSQIGGEVIYAADAGGGYGNVVDIYNKDLGVTERIAEASEILPGIKVGDKIEPGTPVVRGENVGLGGVIHYEIREGRAGRSGSIEGTKDPMKFLKEHTKHKNGVPKNLTPSGDQSSNNNPDVTPLSFTTGGLDPNSAYAQILQRSAQFDAMTRETQLQPITFNLGGGFNNAQDSTTSSQNSFALGLASGGSSSMGTDMFTTLGIQALR